MHARIVTAVAVAAGVFGGVIGALATAATQSAASPAAIAAAVQRVTDSSAERSLKSIDSSLKTVNGNLATVSGDLAVLDRPLSGYLGSALYALESEMFDICLKTQSTTVVCHTPVVVQIPAFARGSADRSRR